MKKALIGITILASLLLVWRPARSKTVTPRILQSATPSPFALTNLHCDLEGDLYNCRVNADFIKDGYDAYGIAFRVTVESGSKYQILASYNRHGKPFGIHEPLPDLTKPLFAVRDKTKTKVLVITDIAVQPDFPMTPDGKVWGNAKNPHITIIGLTRAGLPQDVIDQQLANMNMNPQ